MGRAKLSVNINKYALLRNSRGHDLPNLCRAATVCIEAGAHGITVHPRLDQRHVRFDDLPALSSHLAANHPTIEFNIECEPSPIVVEMVVGLRPDQCTLVPVTPGEVTSDHGWPFPHAAVSLRPVVAQLKQAGIRVSAFVDCDAEVCHAAADAGIDRVELYTGPYARAWGTPNEEAATRAVWEAAAAAVAAGLGVNAGHDLDRHNLAGVRDIPGLLEVSIGHAQICRALEVGTVASVQELLAAL
jgi:pyridoxine 5-phosphate synthase